MIQHILAILLTLAATAAQAQAICANRDMVTNSLVNRYGETVRGDGLQSDDGFVQVWANTETGTWSITLTDARGIMCIFASGKNWTEVAQGDPA